MQNWALTASPSPLPDCLALGCHLTVVAAWPLLRLAVAVCACCFCLWNTDTGGAYRLWMAAADIVDALSLVTWHLGLLALWGWSALWELNWARWG